MNKVFILINNILLLIFLSCICTTAREYQKLDKIYIGQYRVTFYCGCSSCCGQWSDGLTASGVPPTVSRTCACSEEIPFGTKIYIDGLGTYRCQDRGVSSKCIDIYVDNHSDIPSWGLAYLDAYQIIE